MQSPQDITVNSLFIESSTSCESLVSSSESIN
nr:MAG TPA: hypothetical protein [Caudoviricetes sp.]